MKLNLNCILTPELFLDVHPWIQNLLTLENLESFPGWLQYFGKNWEKLKNNPFILKVVHGYEIFFLLKPFLSENNLKTIPNDSRGDSLVDLEILEMFNKKAIRIVPTKEMQGFS